MFILDPISRHLVKASRGIGPLILMYHSVAPGGRSPDWLWSVALDRFVEQMDLLRAAGWQFRKISDFKADNRNLQRAIAVTFDDGYENNLPAFEALAARGLPATWFVVSATIGREAAWKDDTTGGWRMLNGDRLREMIQAGMEIGGHTRHHCKLAEIAPQALSDEIGGCREELEDILRHPVTSFAYPYGSYNETVVSAVAAAGYEVACTTRAGPALMENDPLRLSRLAVYSHDTPSSFARKVGLRRNEATWGRVKDHFLHRAS